MSTDLTRDVPTGDSVGVHPHVFDGLEALRVATAAPALAPTMQPVLAKPAYAGIVARAWGYAATANFIREDPSGYSAGLRRGFVASATAPSWEERYDALAALPRSLRDPVAARRDDVEGWWRAEYMHLASLPPAELEQQLTIAATPAGGTTEPRAAEMELLIRCALSVQRRQAGERLNLVDGVALLVALARATLDAATMLHSALASTSAIPPLPETTARDRGSIAASAISDKDAGGCALTVANYPFNPLIVEVEPALPLSSAMRLPDECRRWRIGRYAPGSSGRLRPDPAVTIVELLDGVFVAAEMTTYDGQRHELARPVSKRLIGVSAGSTALFLAQLGLWTPLIALEYPPAAARIPLQMGALGRVETRGVLGPDGAWLDPAADN